MALAPRKRKRRLLLLLLLSKFNDEYGVMMLCQIWNIYEKTDATLTTPEKDVVQAVDNYYLAYDPADSETFDACAASELDGNTKGSMADALETAINNL